MKRILSVHSDLEDERSDALNTAIVNIIESAEGMYGYVLGEPELLEHYRRRLIVNYLALGRAISEVTDLYEHWNG